MNSGNSRPVLAVVVLAAGQSKRMKQTNKLLAPVDDVPMLRRVLQILDGIAVKQRVVVTGYASQAVASIASEFDVDTVFNPRFREGLSTSLCAGIRSLDAGIDGAIIVLGDMPDIEVDMLDSLINAFDIGRNREICIPVFKGQRGNPVLWSKRFFPALINIQGDRGGRDLQKQNRKWVHEVEVANDTVLRDIDTPEQLKERTGFV